jgi:hypothetical protein
VGRKTVNNQSVLHDNTVYLYCRVRAYSGFNRSPENVYPDNIFEFAKNIHRTTCHYVWFILKFLTFDITKQTRYIFERKKNTSYGSIISQLILFLVFIARHWIFILFTSPTYTNLPTNLCTVYMYMKAWCSVLLTNTVYIQENKRFVVWNKSNNQLTAKLSTNTLPFHCWIVHQQPDTYIYCWLLYIQQRHPMRKSFERLSPIRFRHIHCTVYRVFLVWLLFWLFLRDKFNPPISYTQKFKYDISKTLL